MSFGKKKPAAGGQDKDVVAAAQGIKEVSPLQQIMDAKASKFFNWENSTGEFAGKPRDVTEAPGFGDQLDIYGNAERLAAQDRFSEPGAAFSNASNNGYAEKLKAQNQMRMFDTRAAGLNEGLQGLRGQAYGIADSSINNDMQRKAQYAGALGNYNTGFYNRPQEKPLWEKIAGLAIGGLGAAGGIKAFG